jgi:RNA polymerase sigma factor (sigma-70 family)
MASGQLPHVLQHLRQLVGGDADDRVTDAQLLHQFLRHHDELSFTGLMRRHGPMVLGICRRVLGHDQDAEDAFQATFLVLARRGATIRKPDSLASWLHGVAYRLALKARAEAARRQAQQKEVRAMSPTDLLSEVLRRELRGLIDEELTHLPEKYRAPLILCYLDSQTLTGAAHRLGWTKGTVAGRLARGRDLLRKRLARRGLTMSNGLMPPLLLEGAAPAAVPAGLLAGTAKAALRFAASQSAAGGVVSTSVVRLAEAGIRALVLTKLKVATAVLLVFAVVGLGAGSLILLGPAANPTDSALESQPKTATADAPDPKPDREGQARTDRHGDALPPGALQRLGTARFREKEEMVGIAFSPDGKVLVSGRPEGLIRLWDPATGKAVGQIKGHEGRLLAFAFSPDGKVLASTGGKTVHLWETATGKELRKIPCEVTFKVQGGISWLRVAPIVFSPDGRLLASVASDHAVHVWEVATGKERLQLGPHAQPVDCLAFSPDGKRLISATGGREKGGLVHLWEVATGKEIRQFPIPAERKERTTWPFAISPDGNTLAVEGLEEIVRNNPNGGKTISMGYKVRLIDLAKGDERLQLESQPSVIWSVIFSPDSQTVAVAGMDQTITVWDTGTGKQRHRFSGYPGGMNPAGIQTLAFSPDGKTLASVEAGMAIHLWDLTTGREWRPESETHHSAITHVVYAADGRTIASASTDHTICLWDAVTGRLRVKITGHARPVHVLALSPDGTTLASFAEDQTVRIWNTVTGEQRHEFAIPHLDNGDGTFSSVSLGFAFTADGKTLTAAGSDLKVRLLDVATGKELRQYPIHLIGLPKKPADKTDPFGDYFSRIHHVEFSPDGRTVALATYKTVYLADTVTGQELFQLSQEKQNLEHLAFSPDGKTLATGGWDKTVRLWELATGKVALEAGGFDSINSVAFAPDGRRVALGMGWLDGKIPLLDVATGKACWTFQGHGAYVPTLAFSPDGKRLASGQRDATVLIWDLTPAVRDKSTPMGDLSPKDLDRLWADLAAEDATKAWAARWTLIARPAQTVPFLKDRLPPAAGKDFQHLEQLLADLGQDDFARREAASKELARRRAEVRPVLRYALERTTSAEVRQRLEALLAEPSIRWVPTADLIRRLRALQILEQIGSREAGMILATLAQGSWTAPETQEAKAALKRLAGRARGLIPGEWDGKD